MPRTQNVNRRPIQAAHVDIGDDIQGLGTVQTIARCVTEPNNVHLSNHSKSWCIAREEWLALNV